MSATRIATQGRDREILANLHRLLTRPDTGARLTLRELQATVGEEQVGRVHQQVGTTAAGVRDWAALVATAGALAHLGEACQPAGWLLLGAIETIAPGGELDAHGWRQALGRVADNPWCHDADHALDAALRTADARTRQAAEEFRQACRQRESERERAAVATEVRRIVAMSGLSQRAFAGRIGTSASRLSSYVHGHVVPSATMMLRIKRVEQQVRPVREVVPHAS
ncbi:helix-turn-helix domain-containing protein [Nocardioides nitrophenolicus]|uniref:helix-turn-helix domain-containing protein n=1 Tax=Nocardioides nitrophenolicus TaxID=60489 RepID=UPI00195B62CD|nr:helix-turn-helix transcriptional regulator [Nocardioides nitrophenolicus]MBM7518013.1 DNA-binding transcriptional regulator YiaG [Nocardioides nitrophenolicus]